MQRITGETENGGGPEVSSRNVKFDGGAEPTHSGPSKWKVGATLRPRTKPGQFSPK